MKDYANCDVCDLLLAVCPGHYASERRATYCKGDDHLVCSSWPDEMKPTAKEMKRKMTAPVKYRAVIEGTGEEKAVQFIGAKLASCKNAAMTTLGMNAHKWGAAHVALYQLDEKLIGTVSAEECESWYTHQLKLEGERNNG